MIERELRREADEIEAYIDKVFDYTEDNTPTTVDYCVDAACYIYRSRGTMNRSNHWRDAIKANIRETLYANRVYDRLAVITYSLKRIEAEAVLLDAVEKSV